MPKNTTGPQSFRNKAVKPRRIGLDKRRQWRINEQKSKYAMARYRYGYNLIWRFGYAYANRLKRFPEPGTLDPNNQHGGVMPALGGEFSLTEKQAATLE